MKPACENHLWFYTLTTEMIRKGLKSPIYNSTKNKTQLTRIWKTEPKTWYHKSFKRKCKKLLHIGFDGYFSGYKTKSTKQKQKLTTKIKSNFSFSTTKWKVNIPNGEKIQTYNQ